MNWFMSVYLCTIESEYICEVHCNLKIFFRSSVYGIKVIHLSVFLQGDSYLHSLSSYVLII